MSLEVRKPRPDQETRLAEGKPITEAQYKRPSRAKHAWSLRAMEAVRTLSASAKPFSADNVETIVGPAPHRSCMGSVMRAALRQRLCKPIGASISRRGHLHRLWIGIR